MPRFKTMAQGHNLWPMEAHRRRGVNDATVTSPSTFAALLKNVHWPPEFALPMEARKVQLDERKLAPSPLSRRPNSGVT